MELVGVREEKIKIKKTIFNMEPRLEKSLKVARNLDSGQTQLHQLGSLLHTLLRLEAIHAGAYERWQPYFNEGRLDFLGLVAYLEVFHADSKIISQLTSYFKSRQTILSKLRQRKDDQTLQQKLQDCKSKGMELMEDLRQKIYALQLPMANHFESHQI